MTCCISVIGKVSLTKPGLGGVRARLKLEDAAFQIISLTLHLF